MKLKFKFIDFLLDKIIKNEKEKVITFEKLYYISRINSKSINKNYKIMKNENKYYIYYLNIIKNDFLSFEQKEYLFNIFNKYQKTLFGFRKFLFMYKWNKCKTYDNNLDLVGNNLNNLKKYHLIKLIQNNTKYVFRASDLLNIIKISLLNCSNMKPLPVVPKNPYSNIKFENHNLYNIYFQIKLNTILEVPNIINKYFKYLFSINILKYMEYNFLLNNSIHDYIKNMSNDTHYFELKYMFSKHEIFKNYNLNYRKTNITMRLDLKELLKYYILYNNIIHPLQKKYYESAFISNAKAYIINNEKKIRKYVKVNR